MKRAYSLIALLTAAAACGPKPAPAPVALMPEDGDTHTAKPTTEARPAAPDPWAGKGNLIVPPAAAAPAPVELPPIESFTLANGLKVFVVKSERLPVVSMQLAIRAGRMNEPRARLGVAEATASMLVKGTRRKSAVQIAREVELVGGTVSADATYEATLLSCRVLAKNANTCMTLLPELLTQSTFPANELAQMKQMMTAEVRQRFEDAGRLASSHAQNLLWGEEHVRGWIDNEQSIGALDRDSLAAWAKTWYVPNNAMLVVSGDVDTKKVKAELERTFGRWAKGAVPPPPTYKEPTLSGIRIRLVDKPGQTQTHIRVAQFGIKHDDPRFFNTLVWNYVLGGGGFSSRLTKVVRVDGGKSYGASSGFDRNLDKGTFLASTFTRNAEAVATTKLVIGEIAKMAKEGPTEAEVSGAIANIAGAYGLRFQSAADVGGQLLTAELHGFGTEYLQNYPIAVGAVDVASAKDAAAGILSPRDYVVVLVGDAKDIEPQLKKEGWRYDKTSFASPIGAPPAPAPEAPADAKQIAAARKIVDEALEAKGGKARLAAMKSFRMLAVGTTAYGPQSLPVETERVFALPDRMRIDATIQKQVKVIIAVDGKKGWQQAPDPKTGQSVMEDLGEADLDQIDFERWREPELILLKAAAADAKLRPAADETIDGAPHAVVKLKSPDNLVDVAIYIDRKTKLVRRMTYTSDGRAETDDFGDYRTVSGIKVAHKRTSKGTGANARATDLTLKSMEIDPVIAPSLFVKPAAAPPAPPAPPATPATKK